MRLRRAAAALVLALLPACGGDGSTLGPDGRPVEDGDGEENGQKPVTLARLSAEIFTPKCATSACHAGASPSAALSLEADRLAEMVGAKSHQEEGALLIDPGNPDGSYLIRKVKGTGSGKQMPIGLDPLSPEEIQMIVDWVAAGAPTS